MPSPGRPAAVGWARVCWASCWIWPERRGAGAVFLEVRESNRAARALYEKWAFLESGRRRGYYKDPEEDAILYRLDFLV